MAYEPTSLYQRPQLLQKPSGPPTTGPINNVPGMNMYGQATTQPSAAQAYFNANPDVMRAFQQNSYGMTPEQFAETHYRNYGMTEGRQWNGQGPIQPPNFSQAQPQQPPQQTGLMNMTAQQLNMLPRGVGWDPVSAMNTATQGSAPAFGGPNQAQMLAYQQAAAARQQQNPGTPMQPGPWAGSAAQQFAQPAGQPPQWLQPYLGGAAAGPATQSAAMANQTRQPQALGQSAAYSPANRPQSPWFGGGGVNI